ncbi:flagellar basal body P-ring formation chaperone FlgA [Maritimibacter sp. HL-12]|uniref:flagellar basal body P-ring formation chaperone FlgA n=1 Tax=Maritimibacter sp. HL-12 TaxID=1162418 RepID=UPI000A0F10A3|nr:flagellar basal body P-ring formation chaperone FlgA [Maritimibacter sp. HL-12]SMH42870.1 flagella basal body P-ring formation protein FlgA [Maritimibacter sp. HL-12]
MKRLLLLCIAFVAPPPVAAETVVAARTIRAQTVLTSDDLRLIEDEHAGAFDSVDGLVGLETRVALFAGRPIRPGEIGPPAIIERNQIVTLLFRQSGLEIIAEGRALGRAGVNDVLRVMNLASRQTISGRVRTDGIIIVNPSAAPLAAN